VLDAEVTVGERGSTLAPGADERLAAVVRELSLAIDAAP
jgi:hypothetical protein